MRNEESRGPAAPLLGAPSAQSQARACGPQVASRKLCRLWRRHWESLQSAVGSRQRESRKSQVARDESLVIGHWSLGAGLQPRIAGINSRLQNRSVAKQRIPKLFTLHHSLFTIHSSPILHRISPFEKKRCLATQSKTLHSSPFTLHSKAKLSSPHSSFLIFAPKGAN